MLSIQFSYYCGCWTLEVPVVDWYLAVSWCWLVVLQHVGDQREHGDGEGDEDDPVKVVLNDRMQFL